MSIVAIFLEFCVDLCVFVVYTTNDKQITGKYDILLANNLLEV